MTFDLAYEIVSLLEKNHFTKKRYNEIYVKASEIYLERLDPTRSFLLDHEVLDKVQKILIMSY